MRVLPTAAQKRTLLLATALCACGAARGTSPNPNFAAVPGSAFHTSVASVSAESSAGLPTPPSSQTPQATPQHPPEVTFPPTSFAPPYQKSAKPGDGTWEEVPDAGELGRGVLVRTTVHPHPYNPFVFATVVAIDLRKVELRLAVGTRDPPGDSLAQEHRTGLVPTADQPRLIAVFNGGFQSKHGKHGMMVEGTVLLAAQKALCTVAILPEGRVDIGSWPAVESGAATAKAWRQSPPCLIEQGEVNPLVRTGDARKYGMAIDGKMAIRRTGLGVDATGQRLLFAFGEDVTPALLGEALKAAGAQQAAQLDVNWSYTKFFFYSPGPEGTPLIASSLVPKMKYSKKAYVQEAASRDFFYLLRRPEPTAQQ